MSLKRTHMDAGLGLSSELALANGAVRVFPLSELTAEGGLVGAKQVFESTGVLVIVDIPEKTNVRVLRGMGAAFHGMFCDTESYEAQLDAIGAAAARGDLEGSLCEQVKTRVGREGHVNASFSYLRTGNARPEDSLRVEDPASPVAGVRFVHSAVYTEAFAKLYETDGLFRILKELTGADMVSFDSGMMRCNSGKARRQTKAKCTKPHVDTYPHEMERTQMIYIAKASPWTHLGFVPGTHVFADESRGFCVPECLKSDEKRAEILKHAIAAPERSLVLFKQGIVHGEFKFQQWSAERQLFTHPELSPSAPYKKLNPPRDVLEVRLACGMHKSTYTDDMRRVLALYAQAGFIPESLFTINREHAVINDNIVNRCTTQYGKKFKPSPQARAMFDSVETTSTAVLDNTVALICGISIV